MLKSSVRVIPVLFFALFMGCSEDSETVLLSLEYYPNEGFSIIIRTETNQTKDMPMSFLDEMELKFELDTIHPDGSYTLFADLVRINYDRGASMFDPREAYNSETDPAAMTDKQRETDDMLRDKLDSRFRFSVDDRGRITRPLRHTNGRDASGIIDLQKIYIAFPEKEVGVGDSWDDETTNALTGTKTSTTYTVERIMPDRIFLSTSSDIKTSFSEVSGEGTIELDRASCRLLKYTNVMEMSGGQKITQTVLERIRG